MGVGGSKVTLEEQMKQNKRQINKAIRELEREKRQLENQERKLINDIKANAKKGQMNAVKIMAKDLVRTRKYQQKFLEMKAQLQGVNLQLQVMSTTADIYNLIIHSVLSKVFLTFVS
jgi:charged multivesicular body protein 2A